MDDFTPRQYAFTYKVGSKVYRGSVNIAPSNYEAAIKGDAAPRRIICASVARELRIQGSERMSCIQWSKIKWVD